MLNKHPNDVTLEDIQRLVDTEEKEGYLLDYKVNLPSPLKGEEKKEFLHDVTSFANAYGGYLILGVAQDKNTGLPTSISGLDITNLDRWKQDIENIIRDNVEPRLFAHTIRDFKLEPGKNVIFIHVPRSWNPPHHARGEQFYSRNSNGKFPLSVEQLRRVFTQGADNLERIRRFIRERVFLINAEEGSIPLSSKTAKVVLHLVPLASFEGQITLPIGPKLYESLLGIEPFGRPGGYGRDYNADGIVITDLRRGQNLNGLSVGCYTQIFRSGIVEGAENYWSTKSNDKTDGEIPATAIERNVCFFIFENMKKMRELQIAPPIVISLSIVGAKGYKIPANFLSFREGASITHDPFFIPEVTLEDYLNFEEKPETTLKSIASKLKPIFDALWQSCGYPGSPNFDGDTYKIRLY